MPTDPKTDFECDGFVVVPGALSGEEVQRLRDFFLPILDGPPSYEGDTKLVRMDIAARYPETRFLLWKPEVLDPIRVLLGDDFVFLPEMAVHDTHFGHWHKDTDSPDAAGLGFVQEPDFRMVEVAFYLQDNNEHGGGLDVVPGSHKVWPTGWLDRVKQRLARRKPYSIASKAGDLVLFNFRTDHRATPAKKGVLTGRDRKIAIFFAASANNSHARAYIDYLGSRGDYQYLQDHEYPQDLRELAEEKQLSLA